VLELQAPRHDLDYLTNFERKWRKQGRAIHRIDYQRGEWCVVRGAWCVVRGEW
jgi:hypothetical protein